MSDHTGDKSPDTHEESASAGGLSSSASDFNAAMIHLYRGEVSRSNTWRMRLDATTNWAVVTTGAALTFAFGTMESSAVVIPIVSLLTLLFLFIEARRNRYYELWTHRVRLLENNFFADFLSPLGGSDDQSAWADELTESLRRPAFPITLLEALGRRYRRNYAPLFLILAFSWLAKVYIHPIEATGWSEFLERAAIGPLSGWFVLTMGCLFNGGLIALGIFTVGLRKSDTEVLGKLPRGYMRFAARLRAATREALDIDLASFKPHLGVGRKHLALIISDQVQAVSQPLLKELARGVTLLKGTGMYSGKEHGVLMCVLHRAQMESLRSIVHKHDPKAFIVFLRAQDVRGEGFRPINY